MATGNVTTTTAAAFIPEVWAPQVMLALREALKFRPLVRLVETDKGYGDIIHLPKLNFLAARDKAANTEVVFDVSTDTDVSLALNKHKYHAILVEGIVQVQAYIDQLTTRAQQVIYPVAKAMDIDIARLYSEVTAVVAGGSLSTSTAFAKVADLKYTLDVANAPTDGRVLVVEPYTESILLGTTQFISRDYINGSPLTEGAVGKILGFEVIPSNNIQTSSGAYQNLAFVKNYSIAMGLSKDLGIRSWAEPRHFGDALAADAAYGVKVVEAASCCKFTVTVPGE